METNVFGLHWLKEYLPELQRCQKWTDARRNFTIGNIVLLRGRHGYLDEP